MSSAQGKLFGPKSPFIILIIILIGCGFLLYKNIVERELILLVAYVTIIIFLISLPNFNWVYVTHKEILIFNSLFSKTKYKWYEFDKITFSTQAFLVYGAEGGVIPSFDVATRYCFYLHGILVNSIRTSCWTQRQKDEFNILIFDKADEYGFSVKKLDAEIY